MAEKWLGGAIPSVGSAPVNDAGDEAGGRGKEVVEVADLSVDVVGENEVEEGAGVKCGEQVEETASADASVGCTEGS